VQVGGWVCVSVSLCPLSQRDLVLQVSTMLRRVVACVRRSGKAPSRGSVQCLHAYGVGGVLITQLVP
jgi:hypothetical protein